MSLHTHVSQWLALDQAGHTLPQGLYVSREAFEFDTQVMLKSVWLFACTVAHVKQPGDYYLFEMAKTSIIIVRGRDGEVRAFHNSCAHRGAKVCTALTGSSPRLTCPYHQWTYGLDGRLLAARNMPDGFDKADHGLRPVALENIGGLLFVCLADEPPTIDRARADIAERVEIYNLDRCKVAVQEDLVETANWKLVMENNRECYHCDANHPELLKSLSTSGFGKGLPGDDMAATQGERFEAYLDAQHAAWKEAGLYTHLVEFPDDSWHRVIRLPLAEGVHSQTLDGKPASRLAISSFPGTEDSSLSVWTQPNSWHHFCHDHAVTFSLTPLAEDRTLLRTSWLVHEDAVEGVDYDPENLAAVWRATNAQDSALATLNHAGIATDGYRPGPYSLEEKLVDAFKTFYVDNARAALALKEASVTP
ncbi:MAG: aromatic ring-hydroxylating dioxygenase subunit alpha [Sphingomonadales bacterium]|nr:aromatic ring-hydroxylating dioxygenase subunit alpha [Sphingomonadales bacterium]